jgi:low affinity Fe/Cu permease
MQEPADKARGVSFFSVFTREIAKAAGRPATFIIALGVIVAWALIGPFVGFSSTWQLVVNTGTTIVTFLLLFLVQDTQNRDAQAIHIKLDEIIHVLEEADDSLLDLENRDQDQLDKEHERYATIAKNSNSG